MMWIKLKALYITGLLVMYLLTKRQFKACGMTIALRKEIIKYSR